MLKRIRQLPTASGVAASSTATFDLPLGIRYHAVYLLLGNAGTPVWNNGTDVTEIRIKVDGRVQRRMTPAELDAINLINGTKYGLQATDTIIPIFFSEDWLRTIGGENALAWGTGGIASLQIEIDLGAPATPTLSGRALVDDQTVAAEGGSIVPFPLGKIERWSKGNFDVTQTGDVHQTNLPKRGDYRGIHAFSANVAAVEVKVDNFTILDATKAFSDAVQVSRGKTPIAGRFDILFDIDNQISSFLATTKNDGRRIDELDVIWNMSSAASFDFIARNIDFAG